MGQEKTTIQTNNPNISISDPKLRNAIYKAFNGECFYTGQHVPKNEMHIDHVNPISRGGKNNICNYVLTSKKINLRKGNKVDCSKIERMLYIVSTVFVPKVLKILNGKQIKNQNEPTKSNSMISIPLKSFCSIWFNLGFYLGQITLKNFIYNSPNFSIKSAELLENLEEKLFEDLWKDYN